MTTPQNAMTGWRTEAINETLRQTAVGFGGRVLAVARHPNRRVAYQGIEAWPDRKTAQRRDASASAAAQ